MLLLFFSMTKRALTHSVKCVALSEGDAKGTSKKSTHISDDENDGNGDKKTKGGEIVVFIHEEARSETLIHSASPAIVIYTLHTRNSFKKKVVNEFSLAPLPSRSLASVLLSCNEK
jgi:hypothetical protein